MAIASSTVAIIAAVATAASAAAGAYTAVSAGNAAKASGKYNAAVARNNAQMAQQQAKYEADRIAKRNKLIAGKQRAAYAKSGVDLSNTVDDVMMDSSIEGELDRLAALYSGNVTATGLEARARLATAEGKNAQQGGYQRAAGSILGGAGSMASIYAPKF